MNFWAFYILGCLIAFIWGTSDYYEFKVRNKTYNGRMFEDAKDLLNMIVFSLGSWFAVIMLIFSNDDINFS